MERHPLPPSPAGGSRRVRPGAAALGVGLVAAITATSRGQPPPARVPPPPDCVTADAAFIDPATLPVAVEVIHDEVLTMSPRARHMLPGTSPPPEVIDWSAGRLRGWIATVAVTGPDRAAADAFARSLGYPIGPFPLVPLVGPVVVHNPGLLEVYQTNNSFRSAAAAGAWMTDLTGSARQAEQTRGTAFGVTVPPPIPLTVAGAGDAVASLQPEWTSPQGGVVERILMVAVRIDTIVVQLSVQGGDRLAGGDAAAVMNSALSRVAAACSVRPPVVTVG